MEKGKGGGASFKCQRFLLSDVPLPYPLSLWSHVILKAHSAHHMCLRRVVFPSVEMDCLSNDHVLPKDCLGLHIA